MFALVWKLATNTPFSSDGRTLENLSLFKILFKAAIGFDTIRGIR